MAGHSKWAGIKHKKAIVDVQKGKLFSKLTKEIIVAARIGGGNPDANARLRFAVTKAKEGRLPKDTIERAIKKGTGELPGTTYEEVVLEGYGPGGVAILVEAMTDNKNRATSELRSIFTRNGGNLAGAGSVSWLFTKKGVVVLRAGGVTEDQVLEVVLEAGADDVTTEDGQVVVTSTPHASEAVKQALQQHGLAWESADLTMVPSSTVRVEDAAQAKALLHLLDALEDHDDTQHVWANFDIPDALLAEHQPA